MPPALLFALLLASIYGLVFHGVFGRRLWQLPLFLLTSLAGFLAGQVIGTLVGLELMRVGNVPLASATTGAMLGLAVCWFFTSPTPEPRAPRRRRVAQSRQPEEQVSA
jgi:hypothetical protein